MQPMPPRTWTEIGQLVKARRDQLGLTQQDVANRANERMGNQVLSTANLRIIEMAGRGSYRVRTMIGLARALDWPDNAIDLLLEREADPEDFDKQPTPPAGGAAAIQDEVLLAARIGRLSDEQRAVVLAMIDQLDPEG